uniref:Uncharacterized protein n=1 Tax=Myoviridae sp. ctsGI2 TaxID=2825188 RepID=A0A8S5PCB8_9CAUD|nr:MAG TPA: hypothetical protein [Myoviridae sp. ctsGI2]
MTLRRFSDRSAGSRRNGTSPSSSARPGPSLSQARRSLTTGT